MPLVVGVVAVSVLPQLSYPVPDVSLPVENAVVSAPKEAELVNNATLNVLPDEFVKLCVPTKSYCLKLVHIACDIAISNSP